MKFKVLKGTETYNKIENVVNEIERCNGLALDLVESLGYKKFGTSMRGVGGGISCIKSDTKPEGFKSVGKPYQNLYYPKANNKTLLEKFENLPIVELDEYNDTIGFKSQFVGFTHHKHFGHSKRENMYLIDVHNECKYEPKEDMIEILESEYIKLKHLPVLVPEARSEIV